MSFEKNGPNKVRKAHATCWTETPAAVETEKLARTVVTASSDSIDCACQATQGAEQHGGVAGFLIWIRRQVISSSKISTIIGKLNHLLDAEPRLLACKRQPPKGAH
jgi:hypothetical protein